MSSPKSQNFLLNELGETNTLLEASKASLDLHISMPWFQMYLNEQSRYLSYAHTVNFQRRNCLNIRSLNIKPVRYFWQDLEDVMHQLRAVDVETEC